jgi:hypothetical protein
MRAHGGKAKRTRDPAGILDGRASGKQVKLDGVMARLREAQIKTDECFRET